VRAAPEFGMANPTIAGMIGGGGTGLYTGTLPTPVVADDGNHSVTVTAYLSDDVTTTTSITTNNMSANSCGGTILSSNRGTPTSSTVTKYGTGSGTGTYVLDINPPVLNLKPITAQHSIKQGGNKVLHNVLVGGSAMTNYSLTDTGVGPVSNTATASGGDNFGPAGQRGGIAPDKHDMISLHLPCGCAVGDYNVDPANTLANSADLAGNPFPPVSSANTESWTVLPGESLEDDTTVVSELGPNLDYAEMTCFSTTLGGPAGNQKVNASPGTLHITATINTMGDCAGFGTITFTPYTPGGLAPVSLTIPAGFSFMTSGNSPAAHVFIGPAAKGFNLHYPVTLTEITLPNSAFINPGGDLQTLIVDLSAADLGLGKGVVPANNTIYVRAHARFSWGSVPLDGTRYTFSTSTSAILPGMPGPMTAGSSQDVYALPAVETTSYKACVDGNFTPQGPAK
jgi:hypothetical protein